MTVTVTGAVVTPLSVSRTPGIAFSTTFEEESCWAPAPTRYAAWRSLPVARTKAPSSAAAELNDAVNSESLPVLRADR